MSHINILKKEVYLLFSEIMKLTKLQLKIQKWANKKRALWCIEDIRLLTKSKKLQKYVVIWTPGDYGFDISKEEEFECSVETIGHPMNYWRLCQLVVEKDKELETGPQRDRLYKTFEDIQYDFHQKPSMLDATVLDRSVSLQKKVLVLLETIWR